MFAFIFISNTGLNFSFFGGILICFWYQGNDSPIECVGKHSLLFSFLYFGKDGVLSRFDEAITSWTLLLIGRFYFVSFPTDSVSLLIINLFIFSVSSWFSIERLYISRSLFISSPLSIILVYNSFANKGPSSQSYGFSSSHVWMWELDSNESWALKSWYFWTVVLEKTLESPLDCKEIQQVHPKGSKSEYSLEGLMLKLRLQYFGHLMWRTDSLEKTLMLGNLKVGGKGNNRGWDGWMALPTQWSWVWVSSGSWWWTGRPDMLQSMGSQIGHDWVTELNWIAHNCLL